MAALESILSSGVSQWMGHAIATIFLPDIQYIPMWGFVFQQDGALAHRAQDTAAFLERKVHIFNPPILWPSNSRDLNPVDYTVASGVYCRRKFTHPEKLTSTNLKRVWSTNEHALTSRSWMLLSACSGAVVSAIDVKRLLRFFIYFIKTRFLTFFYFLNVSYFLVAKVFILPNLRNSEIKWLLSDGFKPADTGNSLTKSHNCQTLSCTLSQ